MSIIGSNLLPILDFAMACRMRGESNNLVRQRVIKHEPHAGITTAEVDDVMSVVIQRTGSGLKPLPQPKE